MKSFDWKQPRSAWAWLALLSPAIVMVLCGALIPAWLNAAHPRTGEPQVAMMVNWAFDGLCMGAALSLGLGYWMARGEESFSRRVGLALGYGVSIGMVNIVIAFGGCTAVALTDSYMSR